MTLLQKLQKTWLEHGLAIEAKGLVAVSPTFLEEVGSAAAENIRTAALMRWFNANPERGYKWLESICQSKLSINIPYRVTREHYLDEKNRVDLVVWDSENVPVAFIEAKWSSEVKHAEQLEVYRALIEKNHKNALLVAISPVLHRRPVSGKAFAVITTTWQSLENYLQSKVTTNADSIGSDLWKTCLRLKTLEGILVTAINENRTLEEFMELHAWIDQTEYSKNKSLGYGEFYRKILMTLLADAMAERLNQITAWRRSITINGPRKDTQSDICPEILRDGLISIDGVTANSISLVLRFHVYPKFDSIKIGVGTQIIPYKFKKDKDEYAKAHPQDMQKTADAVLSVRTSLIAELEKAGVSNTKSAKTKKTAWFKEYAPRKFTKLNRVNEMLGYGQHLSPVIIATLQQYTR
jgi:hypothetical protein